MFDSVEQPSHGARLIAQFFLVYPCVAFVAWPALWLYGRTIVFLGFGRQGHPIYAFESLIFAAAGTLLGRFAGRRWPNLRKTGIWIWAPPVSLFLWEFLHELLWPCQGCSDDEGVSSALVKWPAVTMAAYSLGLYMAGRTHGLNDAQAGVQSGPR